MSKKNDEMLYPEVVNPEPRNSDLMSLMKQILENEEKILADLKTLKVRTSTIQR